MKQQLIGHVYVFVYVYMYSNSKIRMIWKKKMNVLIVIFKNMLLSLSQAQFSDDARCCSTEETRSSHVH